MILSFVLSSPSIQPTARVFLLILYVDAVTGDVEDEDGSDDDDDGAGNEE